MCLIVFACLYLHMLRVRHLQFYMHFNKKRLTYLLDYMHVCRMVGCHRGSVYDWTDTSGVGATGRDSVRLLSLRTVPSLGSDTGRFSCTSLRYNTLM